jgi:hypothetical protein
MPACSSAFWPSLSAGLAPKGSYALTVDRQGRTPEIHCVFEKETDALKVASTVGATATGRYPGWASPDISRCLVSGRFDEQTR